VLGTGRLLSRHPGATVVTVFAGNPPAYPDPMRQWDVQCGFAPGDDVMAARRDEDRAALATLDVSPVWLDFVEYSYNPGDEVVPPERIVGALADALAALRPTVVVVPFGLANPDHDATHRACMHVRDDGRFGAVAWWCYEDTGYKHIPGMLSWRVAGLFRRRVWPTPIAAPTDPTDERKHKALACYPSQLRALEEDWQLSAKLDAPAPEQYWKLAAPPEGWDALIDQG
jgi:LmbE family N-acetylglucosaminyl deacetylase